MNGLIKLVDKQEKRVKTKLRCKNGHTWKDVVYTSSALSFTPPLCPKCLKKGIRAVGKPVPIVPLRTRAKSLAKAVTVTPLRYLVAKPVCFVAKYLVAKPVVFSAKVGWFTTKLGAWTAFLPVRLAWGIVSFPFRLAGAILHRIANPVPKVVVIQDSGLPGFVGDEGTFGAQAEEREYCEECGHERCEECDGCHECEDEDEGDEPGFLAEDEGDEPGFLAEDVKSVNDEPGFLAETSVNDEPGFLAETPRAGFAPEAPLARMARRFKNYGQR